MVLSSELLSGETNRNRQPLMARSVNALLMSPLAGLLVAVLAMTALQAQHATGAKPLTMVVQVRTDLKPFREFREVRTKILDHSNQPLRQAVRRVRSGDKWSRGIRVAEFTNLFAHTYRAMVSAIDAQVKVVAQRPFQFKMEKNQGYVWLRCC